MLSDINPPYRAEYGTAEYYAEMFSDILADVNADYAPSSSDNIYKGFLLAINSWLEYHQEQTQAYISLRDKVRTALE